MNLKIVLASTELVLPTSSNIGNIPNPKIRKEKVKYERKNYKKELLVKQRGR